MKKKSGFVLFVVLVFLQIFSLLALWELTYLTNFMKSERKQWERQRFLLLATAILPSLEEKLLSTTPFCIVPWANAVYMDKKPLSWWHQHACSEIFSNIQYYYVVETLGSDACAVLGKKKNNEVMIAAYFRLTLLVLPNKSKVKNMILQSTLVKPMPAFPSCRQSRRGVRAGRQSSREY